MVGRIDGTPLEPQFDVQVTTRCSTADFRTCFQHSPRGWFNGVQEPADEFPTVSAIHEHMQPKLRGFGHIGDGAVAD